MATNTTRNPAQHSSNSIGRSIKLSSTQTTLTPEVGAATLLEQHDALDIQAIA